MMTLLLVLRLIHILCGVLWAGWAFSLAMFIEPAGRAAGPAGGAFMQALTGKTKLVTVMTIAPILVIVSGLWMLWIVSGGFDSAWVASLHGQATLLGSILGLAGFFYGMLMVRPLAQRMGALGAAIAAAGAPPSTEQMEQLTTLRTSLRSRGLVTALLLGGSVAFMATMRMVV